MFGADGDVGTSAVKLWLAVGSVVFLLGVLSNWILAPAIRDRPSVTRWFRNRRRRTGRENGLGAP